MQPLLRSGSRASSRTRSQAHSEPARLPLHFESSSRSPGRSVVYGVRDCCPLRAFSISRRHGWRLTPALPSLAPNEMLVPQAMGGDLSLAEAGGLADIESEPHPDRAVNLKNFLKAAS